MEEVKKMLKSIPHTPGVYLYKNRDTEIIYVGKALDLSKRVRSYFRKTDHLDAKTTRLVAEIVSVDTIRTESEFDALLLEAKLIKQYLPKYNVIAKDDKSPLYIAISFKEALPRVMFTRKPKKIDRYVIEESDKTSQISKNKNTKDLLLYFGPFQSSIVARKLLGSIRRVVPYCTQKKRTGKKCFYTHLGLCSPCPSYIFKLSDEALKKKLTREYRKNIFRIRDILNGKAKAVLLEMEKEMTALSADNRFEEAASLRNQSNALRFLLTKKYDPSVYVQSDTLLSELFEEECRQLQAVLLPFFPSLDKLDRIECFDVSNISGVNATASMVVATNGHIDTSQYRKFKIATLSTPNDTGMMTEALTRRFKHEEWQFPDLLVVDGGKGQVRAAVGVLLANVSTKTIPIIGLAKRQEEIIVPIEDGFKIIRLPYSSAALKLLTRIRNEAHRFAISYHRLLRKKSTKLGG